jgi:acyl-CoA synthetase (AMP-forming)/AMP-acid ligase II
MPDRTREEFTDDGYFRTGDVGEMAADRYLRIVGRAKDLIITGGLNVYPKEIEERIDALPGVAESAVIGVADPDFGEAVTAVVVAKPGHALREADIVAVLKQEMAGFKVPSASTWSTSCHATPWEDREKRVTRTLPGDAMMIGRLRVKRRSVRADVGRR